LDGTTSFKPKSFRFVRPVSRAYLYGAITALTGQTNCYGSIQLAIDDQPLVLRMPTRLIPFNQSRGRVKFLTILLLGMSTTL
jgi:hypothetical protein